MRLQVEMKIKHLITIKGGKEMKKFCVGVLTVLFLLSLSSSASAINWFMAPDNNTLSFGHTVNVGINQIDFLFNATQLAGIYGAGFTMTGNAGGVIFDADLYTWDSYNATNGYWDAFVINVNTQNFYWSLDLLDPITSSSKPAPGATWFWGGESWNDQTLENYFSLGSPETVLLSEGLKTYYISVVLDTKTSPDSDTNHPSWGSFHVTPIPEPTTLLLLGSGLLGLAAFGFKKKRT